MAISFRNRLFGNNSNSTNKNKRKHYRSLRIEQLEEREMLSVTPFTLDDDLNFMREPETVLPHVVETAPLYDGIGTDNSPAYEGFVPTAIPSGDWGTVTQKLTYSQSFGRAMNDRNYGGETTFTLAHPGDANSYIKLWSSNWDVFINNSTFITVSRDGVMYGTDNATGGSETAQISLAGFTPGTYTLTWNFCIKGTFMGLGPNANCYIEINPPVATPESSSSSPSSATYVQGQGVAPISVTPNMYYPGERSYEWYVHYGDEHWQFTGERSDSYTPPTHTVGTAWYHCVVYNSRDGHTVRLPGGNGVWERTVIAVPTDPSISGGGTYIAGESATLTASYSSLPGGGTPTYQWYRMNSGGGWDDVTDVTTDPTYSVPTSSVGTSVYHVVIWNNHGGVSVRHDGGPTTQVTVIGQPTDVSVSMSGDGSQTRLKDESTTLTAHATLPGDIGTLNYQWQQSTNGGASWSSVGTNSANLTVPTNEARQTMYRVTVFNMHGGRTTSGVTPDPIMITVIGAPTITTQPQDAAYLVGDELITDSQRVPIVPPIVVPMSTLTGNLGVVTSIMIGTQSFGHNIFNSNNRAGSFTFTTNSDAPGYVELRLSTSGTIAGQGIHGNSHLTVNGERVNFTQGRINEAVRIKIDGPGTYTVEWQGRLASWGSMNMSIIIDPSVTPTIIESDGTLTVVADIPGNLGTPFYKWEERAVGTSDWTPTGGNSATLTIPTDTTHATEYRVTITNSHGDRTISTVSRIATITVLEEVPPPTDFRRTDATGHSITLSWEPPNMPSIYQPSYIVEYRMSGEGDEGWITIAPSPSADATSIEIAGLERNTAYDFRIRTIHSEWATLDGITTSPLTEDEFDVLKNLYGDLELTNFANYNVIGITAHDFSLAALQHAIYTAANTRETDLIVIHTTADQNTITLDGLELLIDINAGTLGGVIIVGFGEVPLTVNAGHQSRVFNIGKESNVMLAGLCITNGYTSGSGGGIFNAGELLVTECIVSANSASSNGGGIQNMNGTLKVTRSDIVGNSAGNNGGGLYSHLGEMNVNDGTVVARNWSQNSGGGLYNFGGEVYVTASEVMNNWANSGGGGLYNTNSGARAGNNLIQDGILIVSGSLVSENRAGASGGGLYNLGGLVTIEENSTISNNIAGASGGGIVNVVLVVATTNVTLQRAGDLTVSYSTVLGNVAGTDSTTAEHGGGIYNTARLTVEDSEIAENRTSGSGGGIYNTGTANVERSTLIYNRASVTGGGMSNIGGTLVAMNSVVAKNWSNGKGGGIHNHGGVHSLTVVNCTIVGNTTGSSFGGIFCEGVEATNPATRIYNSIIAGNDGFDLEVGELYTNSNTLMTINHSILGFLDVRFYGFVYGESRGNQIIRDLYNPGGFYDFKDLFVDYKNDDYRLFTKYGVATNAIDKGSLDNVPAELRNSLQSGFDRNGNRNGENNDIESKRVVGSRIDIGAYEYGALPETRSIVVTTLDDIVDNTDNLISLREAIMYAADYAKDGVTVTITFADILYEVNGNTLTPIVNDGTQKFALTDGALVFGSELVGASITIDGGGRMESIFDNDGKLINQTYTQGFTIDAKGQSRVFTIAEGVSIVLAGLTITGGNYIGNTEDHFEGGGGIRNNGFLSVIDCRILGNNTNGWGGGIHNTGTLTVSNSEIANNDAGVSGGGIENIWYA
ncbi:MAG: fibronectin type III domain-containing protein, partial [Planctomycetaceae bacterium]|nr:fibronectin type III domain-containing protein [Planctomycetaceae bacterium]